MIAIIGAGDVGRLARAETSGTSITDVVVVSITDSITSHAFPEPDYSNIKLSDYFQIPVIDTEQEIRSRSTKQKSKLRNRRRSFYSKENIYEK